MRARSALPPPPACACLLFVIPNVVCQILTMRLLAFGGLCRLGSFINACEHKKDENCGWCQVLTFEMRGDKKVLVRRQVLVALRDIGKLEELLYVYVFAAGRGPWILVCFVCDALRRLRGGVVCIVLPMLSMAHICREGWTDAREKRASVYRNSGRSALSTGLDNHWRKSTFRIADVPQASRAARTAPRALIAPSTDC